MKYSSPPISVICATYNRPRTLLRLLAQLDDQRCVNFNGIDVCVVDDGSSRLPTPLPVYNFRLDYVYRPRAEDDTARVYSSRNMAAARTTGTMILQLDDDVEFHPYLLNQLQSMAGMAEDKHWVWCARVSNNEDVDRSTPRWDSNWDRGQDGRWYDGRTYWAETHWQSTDSSAMLMPRVTWDAVGGYDETFDGAMGFADQELALRVQKLGARPGDVKVYIAPYFINKEDSETGSHRMNMINRRKREKDNWTMLIEKHPDYLEWTNV
jgi:glycosyltransferase involved in cell wall biosynthesis